RARLSSQSEAVRAARAALETLGDRISTDGADDLASRLPNEVAEFLRHPALTTPDRFSLHEYYTRVAEREAVDLPAAAHHARAVMSVVCDAVSPGEIKDLLTQ